MNYSGLVDLDLVINKRDLIGKKNRIVEIISDEDSLKVIDYEFAHLVKDFKISIYNDYWDRDYSYENFGSLELNEDYGKCVPSLYYFTMYSCKVLADSEVCSKNKVYKKDVNTYQMIYTSHNVCKDKWCKCHKYFRYLQNIFIHKIYFQRNTINTFIDFLDKLQIQKYLSKYRKKYEYCEHGSPNKIFMCAHKIKEAYYDIIIKCTS